MTTAINVALVWLTADRKPIPNCRGFAVRRLRNGKETYLHGFVGFSDDDKLDPSNPWKFPLQRWNLHSPSCGPERAGST